MIDATTVHDFLSLSFSSNKYKLFVSNLL